MGIMKFRNQPFYKKYPCLGLSNIVILHDGRVELCGCIPHDNSDMQNSLIVGDLKKESLIDIINSNKIMKIKNLFLKGKYPKACKECSLYWV